MSDSTSTLNIVSTAAPNHRFTGVQVHSDDCVFVRGVLRDLDEKQVPHTFVMRWINGKWSRYLIHNRVTSQCTIAEPRRKTLSLTFDGSVHIDKDDGVEVEQIDPSEAGPNALRWMWEIRPIGRSVYAVGMLRMVYKRIAPGKWVSFNRGAEVRSPEEVDAGFRSIDGFGDESMVAVGLHGEIWQCAGGGWLRLDSPTNVRLDRVRCVSPGLVYSCGAAGVILRGEGNRWSVVEQNQTEDGFWDMVPFAGKVFFATTSSLYVLENEKLSRVDMKLNKEVVTGYVDAGAHTLWSVGPTDIVVFDGSRWTPMAHPLSHK
jgi:hypothetical protein